MDCEGLLPAHAMTFENKKTTSTLLYNGHFVKMVGHESELCYIPLFTSQLMLLQLSEIKVLTKWVH